MLALKNNAKFSASLHKVLIRPHGFSLGRRALAKLHWHKRLRGNEAEVHHIGSAQCKLDTLEDTVRMCQYVPLNGGFHVVICDEADAMSDAAQKFLLSKLDSSEPVPNTIWIFTCNATDRLEARFLSRCRVLEISTYGMSDAICEHLDHVWHAEGGNGNCPNLKRLAADCHNNIREALMRLEIELMAL